MGKRDQESPSEKRGRRKFRRVEVESKAMREPDSSNPVIERTIAPLKTGVISKVSDETVCDGEMEIRMNDETECVEVEIRNENNYESSEAEVPVTPPVEFLKPSLIKTPPSRKLTQKHSPSNVSPSSSSPSLNVNSKKAVKKQRRESGTSSEEERWLNAIESGKLDDVDDELKKMKDPKLMTARQRAMYERTQDTPSVDLLMSLPIGYREKEKPQTAEDIQKAALKSQKRKQLADEKREKDKKKTMDRLLKKQETTKQRAAARSKAAAAATKATVPMISYRSTPKGSYILIPPDYEFPLKAEIAAKVRPKVQLCGITGCKNAKIYNCSKTNIPLCSFACYRKNVQAVRQIMC